MHDSGVSRERQAQTGLAAFRTATTFAALAAAWMLVSDAVVDVLGLDAVARAWGDNVMDVAFVLVLAALLFVRLQRHTSELTSLRCSSLETERAHLLALDGMPIAVLLHDNGRILHANPPALRLLRTRRREDVVGRHFDDLMAQADRARAREHVQALIQGEAAAGPERLTLSRLDGGTLAIECSSAQVPFGHRVAGQTVLHDLDETARSVQGLAESEARYRKLVELAHDAILLADAETGVVLEANRAAAELFGRPREKLVGMHHYELHPPDDAATVRAGFDEDARGESAGADHVPILRPDGSRLTVGIRASVLTWHGRRVLLGVFRPMGETATAEPTAPTGRRVRDHRQSGGFTPAGGVQAPPTSPAIR